MRGQANGPDERMAITGTLPERDRGPKARCLKKCELRAIGKSGAGGRRGQVQPKQKIGFLIRKASPPSYPQPALTYVRKSFATRDFSGIGASRAPAAPNSGTSVAQRGASAPAGTSVPNGHTQRPGAAETAPGPRIGAYPRAPFSVARPSQRHAALGFARLGAQAPRLASGTPDIPPYAQASRALTFWPHFMPLVNASQMFPPPL